MVATWQEPALRVARPYAAAEEGVRRRQGGGDRGLVAAADNATVRGGLHVAGGRGGAARV